MRHQIRELGSLLDRRGSAQDQGQVPAQLLSVSDTGQSLPLLLGLSVPICKWGS